MEDLNFNFLRQSLFSLQEEKYKEFSSSLLPNTNNIIGVRLPYLRKLAKKISTQFFYEYKSYCEKSRELYFEEKMIYGMAIGYYSCDINEKLKLISDFIPFIDNWSVCDSFCSGLKFNDVYKEEVFDFISKCIASNFEFEARFGLVMLLDYFICEAFLSRDFALLSVNNCNKYYCEMAKAWAVSILYSNFPKETIAFLKNCNLSDFAFKKSIQKICELKGTTKSQKEKIKLIKKIPKNT